MFALKWTKEFQAQITAEEVELEIAIETGIAKGKDVGDTLRKLFVSLGVESGCNAVTISPFLRSVYPLFDNQIGILEMIQIFVYASVTTDEDEIPDAAQSLAMCVSALSCEFSEPLRQLFTLKLSVGGLKRALAVISVAIPGLARERGFFGGAGSTSGRDCAAVRTLHRVLRARSKVSASLAVLESQSIAQRDAMDKGEVCGRCCLYLYIESVCVRERERELILPAPFSPIRTLDGKGFRQQPLVRALSTHNICISSRYIMMQ